MSTTDEENYEETTPRIPATTAGVNPMKRAEAAIGNAVNLLAPFDTVPEVLYGLGVLERSFLAARDRRGVFVSAYLVTSQTLAEWIAAGRFARNDSVARSVVNFANLYLEALTGFENPTRPEIPKAWRTSLGVSASGSATVMQDLLLGINAHLNRDLPFAVLEAGIDVHCRSCRRDFFRINDALRVSIPAIRKRVLSVYRPQWRGLAVLCGDRIDDLVMEAFCISRESAWEWASALQQASSHPERRRVAVAIDQRAAEVAETMLGLRYRPLRCIQRLAPSQGFASTTAEPHAAILA